MKELHTVVAGSGAAQSMGKPVAASGSLELVLPLCEKGLGRVISTIDSPDLILGVKLAPLAIYPDDRGYFLEIQRFGQGLAAGFPAVSSQVSMAMNYPGTIKAFHYHLHQTDCWTPAKGLLQTVLVDLRLNSPTFGARNTLYVGGLRPWQILIPPGVAHGYKVIGGEDAILVYMTDRFYNPKDEGRIPYNDPSIQYDWDTQRK